MNYPTIDNLSYTTTIENETLAPYRVQKSKLSPEEWRQHCRQHARKQVIQLLEMMGINVDLPVSELRRIFALNKLTYEKGETEVIRNQARRICVLLLEFMGEIKKIKAFGIDVPWWAKEDNES